MAENNSYDILYTALNLPRDVVEKVITLQRDQRLSVSQIASAAVTQYVNNLPEDPTHFCDECGAFLPESEFYIQSNSKPFKLCKTHHKAKTKRWMQANKELVNERNKRAYHRKKATA